MRKLNVKRTGATGALAAVMLCIAIASIGRLQETKANAATEANAQTKKCTNETPKGTYGFYGNGTFLPGNPDGELDGTDAHRFHPAAPPARVRLPRHRLFTAGPPERGYCSGTPAGAVPPSRVTIR